MPRREKPIHEVTSTARHAGRSGSRLPAVARGSRPSPHFDTYEEAEQFYAQAQLGDIVPRTRDTFDDWADRWLARKETASVRPNTMAGYADDLKHPGKAFGRYRIQDVTE